jgi:hypothetical protein
MNEKEPPLTHYHWPAHPCGIGYVTVEATSTSDSRVRGDSVL